jgi:hypothetical protein
LSSQGWTTLGKEKETEQTLKALTSSNARTLANAFSVVTMVV